MRLTLDTLETIEKMDNQVPRKAKKVAESGDGRKGKRKVDSKDDKILLRGNAPPGIVPSVLSMVAPNRPMILWIVKNTRKTGLLKRLLNPRRRSPPSIKHSIVSLLRQWKLISRK